MKIHRDGIPLQYKLQLLFFSFQSWAVMISWLQWCTFGQVSHQRNIKLPSMASINIIFPHYVNVTTCYTVTICFIFSGTIWLWCSLYFHGRSIYILPCSICFPFPPNKCDRPSELGLWKSWTIQEIKFLNFNFDFNSPAKTFEFSC